MASTKATHTVTVAVAGGVVLAFSKQQTYLLGEWAASAGSRIPPNASKPSRLGRSTNAFMTSKLTCCACGGAVSAFLSCLNTVPAEDLQEMMVGCTASGGQLALSLFHSSTATSVALWVEKLCFWSPQLAECLLAAHL
jgi:hypothetical protein